MDKVLKTCLSPALDDNYLSKNNASTQVLYLNKRILSEFFQNENCWMDNQGVGKTELFRYNTALRKEFKFVDDLNSHACQTAVERTLRAITRFYDNCQNKVKGKKNYPKFKKHSRSVEYKVSGWKLSKDKRHITFGSSLLGMVR